MEANTSRAEAERLLGVAEKLLQSKDLNGSRDFAILAQETEPLLDGSDQILAVVDVLLAAQKRINNHHDWYAILQLDRRSDDLELIKKQYRRLALLLHPDKNKFVFADAAFKLVADAWAVLSDSSKKSLYDNELGMFSKVDLSASKKLPVRRTSWENNDTDTSSRLTSFWTTCPYCYNLYQYPRVYEGCCLKCQNCQRAFEAVVIPTLPPMVPGKDAYYCCWGFFPMGFVPENSGGGKNDGFPNWMPPMFPTTGTTGAVAARVAPNGGPQVGGGGGGFGKVRRGNVTSQQPGMKKRGRPRKNPQV